MISWSEHVDIDRPAERVLRAVRDQHEVMAWSAWPEATGYTCAVDGDGVTPGSSIVFRRGDGTEMGRQTIVGSDADGVRSRLRNRGPGGRVVEPEIDFRVEPLGPERTRMHLDFRIEPPVPRLLAPLARVLLRRRIRPLHRQDLVNLKERLEREPATDAA